MFKVFTSVVLFTVVLFAGVEDLPEKIPVPNQITLVDIGSKTCIPCKMMAPVLIELHEKYKGKASILFIDTYTHKNASSQYRIRVIPTQIFYDHTGVEIFRHEGYFPKEHIEEVIDTLLQRQKDA